MGNYKYDVVIPLSRRDVPFIGRVVKYIRNNLVGAQYIYIITANRNLRKLSYLGRFACVLIDEDKLLEGLSYTRVFLLLKKHGFEDRTGWFLQQYIKLGFALSKYSKDYYLSWDADTLPLRKIVFFDNDHPVFTVKNEHNPAYFFTIENIFGYKKFMDYSFVSENMLFVKEIVYEMIQKIELNATKGNDWIERIIEECDYNHGRSPFSEFETYGTYCSQNYPGLYQTRKLCTFRHAGLIRGRFISDEMLKHLSFDLDMASFEIWDGPMFPYNIRQLYYKSIRKLNEWRGKR